MSYQGGEWGSNVSLVDLPPPSPPRSRLTSYPYPSSRAQAPRQTRQRALGGQARGPLPAGGEARVVCSNHATIVLRFQSTVLERYNPDCMFINPDNFDWHTHLIECWPRIDKDV